MFNTTKVSIFGCAGIWLWGGGSGQLVRWKGDGVVVVILSGMTCEPPDSKIIISENDRRN
jgi:hypothetical protein